MDRTVRTRRLLYVVAGAATLFLLGTVAAPWLASRGNPWGAVIASCYAPVCHQLAERSFPVLDGHQAVCTRCAGLYLGGIVGLLAGALLPAGGWRCPRPRWLALALAPTVADWLLPQIGLPGLPGVGRLLLAVPLGLLAALFVAAALAETVHAFVILKRPAVLEEPDG
jgi:uncharacterized membrane protein